MRFLPLVLLLACCQVIPTPADADDADADPILREAVARLPMDPLAIEGDLIVRRPRGLPVQKLRFTMDLAWGQDPPTATYTIRDAFGALLETMSVTRMPDGQAHRVHTPGDGATNTVPTIADGRIQQSDLTWTDLALDFLWWRGARLVGAEKIRDRDCHIIDVPAPQNTQPTLDAPPYATVRIWVDREMLMLLQAEGYDQTGTLTRRLWVHSFKKIDDRWMIKDMEIQSYPVVHRTKLRIQEVRTGETR